ncbi:uncharacterized protein LAJ45_09432 [Morchella importuna]|uniref:uncharacterized protein n=1 Tax=Morchella importuna TaxID=1174673 RepID=UPI001E8D7D89|nr:uncharacterized protein LAJ45_09432 [Morchella importuna]KAH8146486.1 hypothetical protein LAJ45_09432 [Morchella importuna]
MDLYADRLRELQPLWSSVENWAVRLFFFMGAITLLPWVLLIVFDAGVYVWRCLVLALGLEAGGRMWWYGAGAGAGGRRGPGVEVEDLRLSTTY